MGFFTSRPRAASWPGSTPSQSLSGWDGVFHLLELRLEPRDNILFVAIPFRVGWGFSPGETWRGTNPIYMSQSLSGWDGVFHMASGLEVLWVVDDESQSLSGWDGVFHKTRVARCG